ncbi:putative cytoplasmic protein [Escherichia coli]|uniref:Putative cytoplasmic protein n=1 Tax=Escherichia coli TaxID=562 RepID=A0A377DTJ3_ECOLX|nr:putative cytoplasmic protein [Escherichia coli]
MSHLDEVIARVDAAIEESVIAHMNELLIALSDDAELSREDRYTQQQRLRTAIAHHGRKHKEDMEARHETVNQRRHHPLIKMSVWLPTRRQPQVKLRHKLGRTTPVVVRHDCGRYPASDRQSADWRPVQQ